MEQWSSNVCSQLRHNVSCPFFIVRQLFKRDTTAIFVVVLTGTQQQACGQVLGFGGGNTFLGGDIFVFILSLKQQTAT